MSLVLIPLLLVNFVYVAWCIPTSMKYTIPAGDLVNTFDVSPPASGGAYQRDETYHCFDVDSNGFPTYVRGKPHTLSLLLSCYYYYYHAYCWSYY